MNLPSKQVGWERKAPILMKLYTPNYTAAESHADVLLIGGESLIQVY